VAEYQALTGLAVVDFQPLMAFLRERWQDIIQQKEFCGRFSTTPKDACVLLSPFKNMWQKIIHPESPEENRAWIPATDRAFGGRNSTTFTENLRKILLL
jgi:hypothetical protein